MEEFPEKVNSQEVPPTALKPNTRYEKLADAFGGEGIFVKTYDELVAACKKVFNNKEKLFIVNVMIDPSGTKKPQEHAWLTREAPKPKL